MNKNNAIRPNLQLYNLRLDCLGLWTRWQGKKYAFLNIKESSVYYVQTLRGLIYKREVGI